MPNKYVPPHLRNKDGSLKTESSYPSQNSNHGNRGGQGFRSQEARGSYNGRNGGRDFNQNNGSNYNPGRRNNQGYGGGGGRFAPALPPKVVSFVEQQKAKGIDPFKLQDEPAKPEEKPQTNSRFASWDTRSSSSGKGKRSPLGFHGTIGEDQEEASRIFSAVKNTGINFDKYDAIPVEVSGQGAPGPLNNFDDEEAKKMLAPRLLKNLALCGFRKPTPVQKHSIPIGLAERDLMACAQTGSGKTGGFLFPIISLLLKNGALVVEGARQGRYRTARPNALILGPTRELVIQIFEEAQKFCYGTGIRSVVVYGGANSRDQKVELGGGCDILVGTPGRLTDFLERGDIELCCIQQLVLDEADRMLDMGFEPSIRKIVHELDMPRSEERRTFMFSATFPREIQKLAGDFMNDYIFLTVGRVGSAAKDITQTLQYVQDREKRDSLVSVLNAIEGGLVLVFVQTKRNAEGLQYFLYEQGFPTASIHGDRTQQEREQALEAFKTGQAPILVATDVAARGLDIDNVTFVINYDLPGNIDDYVHRIGRTGRAGNKGTALSFFNERNANIAGKLLTLLQENNQTVPEWLRTFGQGGSKYGGGGGRSNNTRDYRNTSRGGGGGGGGGGRWNSGGGGGNSSSGNHGGGGGGRRFNAGGGGGRTSNAGNQGVADAW